MDQRIAGMPVALAMFKASVGTEGANGDERKKTVFRSSSALRMHCTARKLTKNEATLALANLATRTKLIDSSVPATRVKGIPESDDHEIRGFISPNTIVRPKISKPDPSKTIRAAT